MLRLVESTWTIALIALLPLGLTGCGNADVAPRTGAARTQDAEPATPRHFAAPQDAKPLLVPNQQPVQVAANSTPSPFEAAQTSSPVAMPLVETQPAQPQQEELADSVVPWARPVIRPDRIATAVHQADARTRNGISLARRGATLTARAEFVQALRILADAMDEARGCTAHRDALARGLSAIEESGDFLSDGARLERNRTVAETVAGHRTPILRGIDADQLTATAAYERYLDYAQEQLGAAARGEPVASMALYGLGRSVVAASQDRGSSGEAAVCYQAALSIDRRNFLAANELGVLLARRGDYRAARQQLVASWEEGHHAATLKNLVAVHHKLGEVQLARKAEKLLVAMTASRPVASGAQPGIRWTDAASFAKTSETAAPIARAAAAPTRPVATTATAPRRESTSWLPWNTDRQR